MVAQFEDVSYDPRTSAEGRVVQFLSNSFSPSVHPMDEGSASPEIAFVAKIYTNYTMHTMNNVQTVVCIQPKLLPACGANEAARFIMVTHRLLSGVYTSAHVWRTCTPYMCAVHAWWMFTLSHMYGVHVRHFKHVVNDAHVRRTCAIV